MKKIEDKYNEEFSKKFTGESSDTVLLTLAWVISLFPKD